MWSQLEKWQWHYCWWTHNFHFWRPAYSTLCGHRMHSIRFTREEKVTGETQYPPVLFTTNKFVYSPHTYTLCTSVIAPPATPPSSWFADITKNNLQSHCRLCVKEMYSFLGITNNLKLEANSTSIINRPLKSVPGSTKQSSGTFSPHPWLYVTPHPLHAPNRLKHIVQLVLSQLTGQKQVWNS